MSNVQNQICFPTLDIGLGTLDLVGQLKIEVLFLKDLRRFENFAAFNTAGANFLPSIAAGGQLNTNRLQIRIKPAARFVVRVGNIVSELRTFAADIASFCHNN